MEPLEQPPRKMTTNDAMAVATDLLHINAQTARERGKWDLVSIYEGAFNTLTAAPPTNPSHKLVPVEPTEAMILDQGVTFALLPVKCWDGQWAWLRKVGWADVSLSLFYSPYTTERRYSITPMPEATA
jgi:hypothetical protein